MAGRRTPDLCAARHHQPLCERAHSMVGFTGITSAFRPGISDGWQNRPLAPDSSFSTAASAGIGNPTRAYRRQFNGGALPAAQEPWWLTWSNLSTLGHPCADDLLLVF